ncbi:MAG: hypothetical protein CL886_00105 [Dehalococcoidia bacterium]|nr:hypothetical protein [Dehalococcoidia bacterium]|tara:strand:- start:1646 stop:2224 length:579 start_codon:yes stop_codon:yes gene_type:complete
MATEKVDTLQSAQIKAIEDNVNELKTKLNLMVNDVHAITAKVNTVIGDLNNMNDVIMEGYTTPSSPESYGILESLDRWKNKLADHEDYTYGTWHFALGSWRVNAYGDWSHPYISHWPPSSGRTDGGYVPPSYDAPALGGTDQGGNSPHSAGAQNSTAVGSFQGDKKRMLTVKRSEAKRAKKLARQTLNRLRK